MWVLMVKIRKYEIGKKFMLEEMTYRNASKFAIFLEYENSHIFFIFELMNVRIVADYANISTYYVQKYNYY